MAAAEMRWRALPTLYAIEVQSESIAFIFFSTAFYPLVRSLKSIFNMKQLTGLLHPRPLKSSAYQRARYSVALCTDAEDAQ